MEAEKPLSAPAEQSPRPAHVRRQRTQFLGDAMLLRYSGIKVGEKLYERLHMKMLSRLSLPEESPKARKHPDIASRSYYVADNLAEVVMVDFLQMCGQHKTARRCKQCGMLFVPFSSAAKYCDRKSPNGGQRTCKEVAAEEVAKSRTVRQQVLLFGVYFECLSR